MPEAFKLAKEATTLDQYLERLGSLPADEVAASTEQAATYFGTLLNGEREALRLGRKETFLMLQDDRWRGMQERYYWLVQEDRSRIPETPISVESVQVVGDYARVYLAEPLPSIQGLPPQSLGTIVYMRRQNGGWRHASVLDGYTWLFPPPVALAGTPTPIPAPTRTPTPAPTRASGQGSD
jgi:hypothetical protein